MKKISPCMYCGSAEHVKTYKPMYGRFEGNYMCECSTCGIHTAGDCDTPEEAIANWNEDMATPRMRPMTLTEMREFVYDLEETRIAKWLAIKYPNGEPEEEGITYVVPDGY